VGGGRRRCAAPLGRRTGRAGSGWGAPARAWGRAAAAEPRHKACQLVHTRMHQQAQPPLHLQLGVGGGQLLGVPTHGPRAPRTQRSATANMPTDMDVCTILCQGRVARGQLCERVGEARVAVGVQRLGNRGCRGRCGGPRRHLCRRGSGSRQARFEQAVTLLEYTGRGIVSRELASGSTAACVPPWRPARAHGPAAAAPCACDAVPASCTVPPPRPNLPRPTA
jgi:hypothetical protein